MAQDSPIYGPERRGAPVAAFTRIDTGPIKQRGVIVYPDLVVIADASLIQDPAARCWTASMHEPRSSSIHH